MYIYYRYRLYVHLLLIYIVCTSIIDIGCTHLHSNDFSILPLPSSWNRPFLLSGLFLISIFFLVINILDIIYTQSYFQIHLGNCEKFVCGFSLPLRRELGYYLFMLLL